MEIHRKSAAALADAHWPAAENNFEKEHGKKNSLVCAGECSTILIDHLSRHCRARLASEEIVLACSRNTERLYEGSARLSARLC